MHYAACTLEETKLTRIVLAYKNFAAITAISHIGLGVTALNTCKVLQERLGVRCEVWAVDSAEQLRQRLKSAAADPVCPVTHLVMSAPWIPALEWQRLCIQFDRIRFAVTSHSNVGFLAADPLAVRFMSHEGQALEMGFPNFTLAANSEALTTFIRSAYAGPCTFLPNLYHLTGHTRVHRPLWTGGTLKIGSFGAFRPLKNHISAGAAAIELASRHRANLEFYVSGGRKEGWGGQALTDLFASCKFARLIEVPWEQWPVFRRTVASMNLLMQPSYTESFNVVTADGIAEGVPSVVSPAIEWVPHSWQADPDDVGEIAKVGGHLLRDHDAAAEGLASLERYVTAGIHHWAQFIKNGAMPTGAC